MKKLRRTFPLKNRSKLFLIPNLLGNEALTATIPSDTAERIRGIKILFAESRKEAVRQLVRLGLKSSIEGINIAAIGEGVSVENLALAEDSFRKGEAVGLISDAGMPAVADPGQEIIALAHRMGVGVIPLTGPSSILLALMASGFNGQSFAFNGYLPKKSEERKAKIREAEKEVYRLSRTQIFIETPYRNKALLDDLASVCEKKTKICLAVNLCQKDEWIAVDTAEGWRKRETDINKKPCIFLIFK